MMTPSPVCIADSASVREAAALLIESGISAAPVIDGGRRVVGVISRADIVRYERDHHIDVSSGRAYALWLEDRPLAERGHTDLEDRISARDRALEQADLQDSDSTMVCEIMTPTVYTVGASTPASEVVGELLDRGIKRLFVVDDARTLVGVVSATDVLRHLRMDPEHEP